MDKTETKIFILVILTLVLLLGCAGVFILAVIKQRNKINAMNKARLVAECDLMETERSKMAADLHDELGPSMASIKRCLECVLNPGEVNETYLVQAIEYIDYCISFIRKETIQLMPVNLLQHSFIGAIESLLEIFNRGNTKVYWQHHALPSIAPEMGLHLYRIIQELATNTIKHANAGYLRIEMAAYHGRLMIDAEDNGIGMPATPAPDSGIGLSIMQKRVALLKGDITIAATAPHGTHITINIPLKVDSNGKTRKHYTGR